MLAAILLFGAALVAAQEPRPCNTPQQWTGNFYRSDFSKNFTQFAKMYYDETNKRVRELEELDLSAERDFFDVLYLHNQNKEYRVDLRTRKCNVSTLTRPFRPFGVPPEGRYFTQSVVGPVNIANEHVRTISFDGKFDDGAYFIDTVSSPDCVPISADFYDNQTGLVRTTFFDIVIGIPDPEAFNIPKECLGPGR